LPKNTFEQNKHEFVKSLLLYGRNASGKSNVLLAVTFLQNLINESDAYKHDEQIGYYEPFLFDENYKNKPVKFEIDFISLENKIRFVYSVSFIEKEVNYESLYFYPSSAKAKLFERKKNKITYGDYYKGAKKRIEADLLPNQLFLSKSATSNIKYLNECYLYFNYMFALTIHDTEFDNKVIELIAGDILKNRLFKKNILELLKAADTSIQDFKITKYLTKVMRSLFHIQLYENGREIDNSILRVNPQLDVYSIIPLDMKKRYRVVVFILTNLNILNTTELNILKTYNIDYQKTILEKIDPTNDVVTPITPPIKYDIRCKMNHSVRIMIESSK